MTEDIQNPIDALSTDTVDEMTLPPEADDGADPGDAENTADPETSELPEQLMTDEGAQVGLLHIIEAVLFATDEPLSADRIIKILNVGTIRQIRDCIEELNTRYEQQHSAFRIEQIAGGYQMMTLAVFNYWLKSLLRNRSDNKLSPAMLETLAIVAYKQPVIRADVEAIRGVACGEGLRNLMYKGLIKMVGRAEVLGRPVLYGTTKKFLEVFGLNSLKDLPKIEELKKPTG